MYFGNKQSKQADGKGHVISFLSHADEPIDKYDAYLHYGAEPRDSSPNVRSMFGGSTIEDKKWFVTARKYMSRNI
jgi:hypothetical protein